MASPSPMEASVAAQRSSIAVPVPAAAGFGVLLRRHRETALLTQEELAERAELSPRTIRDLEAGRVQRPRGASVRRLVQALGLQGSSRMAFQVAANQAPAPVQRPLRPTGRDGEHPPPVHGSEVLSCQLPATIADFTGRGDLLANLCEWLATSASGVGSASAVSVATVAGKAGVGKTALAVHAAHQLREVFSDGQLYVRLGGAHAQRLDPGDVLGGFLRALGLDAAVIPDDIQERAALFRARTANRRILVLIDDAGSEAQVRPLLPGGPGCGVLVTGRRPLAALEGARLVDLEVFELGLALELLSRIVGPARVAAEQDAARAIVNWCGRLPLAVRVAGVRLLAKPHWPLRHLADRLGDERRRLDELAAGDLEVRASVALTYQGLDCLQRRAFYRLGLLEAADFGARAVAALLDVGMPQAEELAEALVDARLLEVLGCDDTGQLRYRFHTLIRLFAREHAALEEGEADRQAALERVQEGWLG